MRCSDLPVSSPDSQAYRLLQDSDWVHAGLAEKAPVEIRTALTMILDCPEPLWISWGPDNLFFFNDAFAPWMGNKLAGAMATPVRIVWHDVWDELGGAIADAMAGTHRSFRNLRVFMDRDGTRRETFWTFSYSPIRTVDGSVCGILCVVSDQTEFVSERNEYSRMVEAISEEARQAHGELVRAREQLRQSQKLEAIGQLTGGVAHDFNNLLQVIAGSVDMLNLGAPCDERQRRHIDAISAAADRATSLVSHLLSFSRRQSLSPQVFDLAKGVDGLAAIIRTLLGARITLQLDLPDEPLHVLLDKTQLDTALINLSVNARDAIAQQGTVRIRVHRVDSMPSVRFAPPLKGSFAAISVTDDGCGIEESVMSQVFDPFFTTKGVGEGTGLGLSQVFGFVKQSEGEVDVNSTVGEGSTFVLYLPLTQQTPSAVEGADSRSLQGVRGLNVLVVEDNVDVAAFAVSALRELGCGVFLEGNGIDALKELEQNHAHYHVVFSDVVMPGMSGLALIRTVRASYPDLHVVLTSGYSELLARESDHGFTLLRKPYTLERLAAAIQPPASAASVVFGAAEDGAVWRTLS